MKTSVAALAALALLSLTACSLPAGAQSPAAPPTTAAAAATEAPTETPTETSTGTPTAAPSVDTRPVRVDPVAFGEHVVHPEGFDVHVAALESVTPSKGAKGSASAGGEEGDDESVQEWAAKQGRPATVLHLEVVNTSDHIVPVDSLQLKIIHNGKLVELIPYQSYGISGSHPEGVLPVGATLEWEGVVMEPTKGDWLVSLFGVDNATADPFVLARFATDPDRFSGPATSLQLPFGSMHSSGSFKLDKSREAKS